GRNAAGNMTRCWRRSNAKPSAPATRPPPSPREERRNEALYASHIDHSHRAGSLFLGAVQPLQDSGPAQAFRGAGDAGLAGEDCGPTASEGPMIIFDLDGTLTDCEHRRHHVSGPKKDWPAFHAACIQDRPRQPIIEIARALIQQRRGEVEVWSGRDEAYRELTEQ